MIDPKYKAQVDLLLQTIPFVAKETIFVLKRGKAINLFVVNTEKLLLARIFPAYPCIHAAAVFQFLLARSCSRSFFPAYNF